MPKPIRYTPRLTHALLLLLACFTFAARSSAQAKPDQSTWHFRSLDAIGGQPLTVVGHPQIIDTPIGKATHFNGVDDALFVNTHPLAGASTWTWEMIFSPDADGAPAQRVFHLSVLGPDGKDLDDRMLFEIRIQQNSWCLDSFATTGAQKLTLLNCDKRYPFGHFYRVTAVYDGKTLRNYVNDELQGQGDVQLAPQGQGHASVGTRINKRDFFKGSVYEARFTRHALAPGDFLKLPPSAR